MINYVIYIRITKYFVKISEFDDPVKTETVETLSTRGDRKVRIKMRQDKFASTD